MYSVIIPTYNRAHSICYTLDSVKAQTYRPIEIIVVDDGSNDDTETVVQDWKLNNCRSVSQLDGESVSQPSEDSSRNLTDSPNHRLSDSPNQLKLLYVKQENAGAPAARNRGLQKISGDYVQFLDSDDKLHPDRLKMLADAFENQNADFIQTSIEWFDPETGKTVNTLWARPWANQVHLVLNGEFWANTLRGALRRDLVDRIGPWETQMTCFEDREYMERAVLQAKNPIALKPILGYLARGKGMHVSNKHRSYEGRRWRIYSERRLIEQVLQRNDLGDDIKLTLASRIYRVGCRSAASGWHNYAKECVEIGDLLDSKLDFKPWLKRLLCKLNFVGGYLYRIVKGNK